MNFIQITEKLGLNKKQKGPIILWYDESHNHTTTETYNAESWFKAKLNPLLITIKNSTDYYTQNADHYIKWNVLVKLIGQNKAEHIAKTKKYLSKTNLINAGWPKELLLNSQHL